VINTGDAANKRVRRIIVAIDGPSGAGKSTLAKRIAKEMDFIYMDTGAMYRAFAWKVAQEGIDLGDEERLRKVLGETEIDLTERDGRVFVFLNGIDVTDRIRTPEVSQMASKTSALKAVRERMLELQRALGSRGGVVAEGRDIGTVVFSDAEVKIYLDASARERGRRRFEELRAGGKEVSLEGTLSEMQERDRRDSERELAPLRQAEDALVIDSSLLDADAVAERVIQEIKKKISEN
jgi:CMP/dCMP kinase